MNGLKQHLKATKLGKAVYFAWRLFPEYLKDALSYARHSKTFSTNSKGQMRGQALELTHALEKGFATRETRSKFGSEKAKRLAELLESYESYFGEDDVTMFSRKVLAEHSDWCGGRIKKYQLTDSVRLAKKTTPNSAALHKLIRNRVSIRQFSDATLRADALAAAVQTAQSAPSSCNRQASKLHYYDDRNKIRELLLYQGGANSFIDEIPALAIITSDTGAWDSPNERSQGLVDSGMFAMNLIIGLEAEGLGSCPLNLALIHRSEKAIKVAGNIPANERLVVAVAIGDPEAQVEVAMSTRLQTDDIFIRH